MQQPRNSIHKVVLERRFNQQGRIYQPIARHQRKQQRKREQSKERAQKNVLKPYLKQCKAAPILNAAQVYLEHLLRNRAPSQLKSGRINDIQSRLDKTMNTEKKIILSNQYTELLDQFKLKERAMNQLDNDLRGCTPDNLEPLSVKKIKERLESKRLSLSDFELQQFDKQVTLGGGIERIDLKDYIIAAFNIEGVVRLISLQFDELIGQNKVEIKYEVTHLPPSSKVPSELKISLNYQMEVRGKVHKIMNELKIASKIRFLTADLKRELQESQTVRSFWESLKNQVSYKYTDENELIMEALSHQVIDNTLYRLSKLEQKLESYCEVTPIREEKLQILKEFKKNPRFQIQPKWLSEIQILKKGDQEVALFYGKSKESIEKQSYYSQLIDGLHYEQISGFSSEEVQTLMAIDSTVQKTRLEAIIDRSKCILQGQLPNQDNKLFCIYALSSDYRDELLSDLQITLNQTISTEVQTTTRKWTNVMSFNQALKFHHNLRYFNKIKESKLNQLQIYPGQLQIKIQLPMSAVNQNVRAILANASSQIFQDKIFFKPEHRYSLQTHKGLAALMNSNVYVFCQFETNEFILLRSYDKEDLEDYKQNLVNFIKYQVKLPSQERAFSLEQFVILKKLKANRKKFREKWEQLQGLDYLRDIRICEEEDANGDITYFMKFEATQHQKQQVVAQLRQLLGLLSFNQQQVTPLTESLLKLQGRGGDTKLDYINSLKFVICEKISPLLYEVVILQEREYEKDKDKTIKCLTGLGELIQQRLLNLRLQIMRKIGVLLEFSRMPRYVPELNCVLDIDNNAGIKVYSLRTQDQDLFLQYLKILEEGLGPVFPFEVQTNSSQLLEKKLNYKKIEKDHDCKVRSWLHEKGQKESSLYVYAKGCPPEGYQQVQEGVKHKIKENEGNKEVVVLLCPEQVIEKVREKEFNNELLADITQLTVRSLKQPQWIVRKLDDSQSLEQTQIALSKSLIWKQLKDTEIPEEIHTLIEQEFQNGVTKKSQVVKVVQKTLEVTMTFNNQGDSYLKIGVKTFALRRVFNISELCFFKRHLQNLAETVVSFINFIPIDWEIVKQKELDEFLEDLMFTDVTYLQQQEGIVLNAQMKQLYYLSIQDNLYQQTQQKFTKLKEISKRAFGEYQVLYQFKNKVNEALFPVQRDSQDYKFLAQYVPRQKQGSFTAQRIQNLSSFFQLTKFRYKFSESDLKRLELFKRGSLNKFTSYELVPLEKQLPFSSPAIESTRPSLTAHEVNSEESKSQRLQGKYIMYQLYYSSMNEEIFNYDGLEMDPTFFDSKFEVHDLLRVRNYRGDLYYVPKQKCQLLPLYEITF